MGSEPLLFSFFLIFSGAAAVATLALYTRQPLLVAYIALGAAFGPYGFKLVAEQDLLKEIAHIGIIFLLFLLGLDLQPSNLAHLLKKATIISLVSSIAFFAVGFGVGYAFNLALMESVIVGIAMLFSSTIIGIKLLPTTVLHHKYTGELVVSLLLLQDIIAIFVIILIFGGDASHLDLTTLLGIAASLPALLLVSFGSVRWILLPLIQKFDRIHEYIFLLAIGWCLGMAELAVMLGLSLEIGAFVAGVSLASSPISQYIANSLKPLRDFFLILFFFSLGAGFNFRLWEDFLVPALLLAALMLTLKPLIYFALLRAMRDSKKLAWEVGFRLGQISEFSLLIAIFAVNTQLIGEVASLIIQATALVTFLISSYIVVFNFPTPIAVSDKLRKD
jgi:Kef-type K+ transport system membrane component KefB